MAESLAQNVNSFPCNHDQELRNWENIRQSFEKLDQIVQYAYNPTTQQYDYTLQNIQTFNGNLSGGGNTQLVGIGFTSPTFTNATFLGDMLFNGNSFNFTGGDINFNSVDPIQFLSNVQFVGPVTTETTVTHNGDVTHNGNLDVQGSFTINNLTVYAYLQSLGWLGRPRYAYAHGAFFNITAPGTTDIFWFQGASSVYGDQFGQLYLDIAAADRNGPPTFGPFLVQDFPRSGTGLWINEPGHYKVSYLCQVEYSITAGQTVSYTLHLSVDGVRVRSRPKTDNGPALSGTDVFDRPFHDQFVLQFQSVPLPRAVHLEFELQANTGNTNVTVAGWYFMIEKIGRYDASDLLQPFPQ